MQISLTDILNWGVVDRLQKQMAHESGYAERMSLTDISNEAAFRNWSGYSSNDVLSLAEFVKLKVHPHFIFWVLLHDHGLPSGFVHQLSLNYGRHSLDRLNKDAVSADYRFNQLLETKQQWIQNEASLGNLNHAIRKATDNCHGCPTEWRRKYHRQRRCGLRGAEWHFW